MASYRKRGNIWYYRYVDEDGVQRERKGCPDRRVTEQLAAKAVGIVSQVKDGLVSRKQIAVASNAGSSVAGHLNAWHRDMLAKDITPDHANQSWTQASRIIALTGGVSLSLIVVDRGSRTNTEAVKKVAGELQRALESIRLSDLNSESLQLALAQLRDAGRSPATINNHKTATRKFCIWLLETGRIAADPMRKVTGYSTVGNLRHERRALSHEEVGRLIASAESGPSRYRMSGTDRAMAYRLASLTGLRVNEIRSLAPESFVGLDGDEPIVMLKASAAKNRTAAEQPLPRSLARLLIPWLATKAPGEPVLPLPHNTAKSIKADLEAAGVAYTTADGVADFHALRAHFVTALIDSGATVKVFAALARHKKAQTSLDHYAKIGLHDLRGAVETLSEPENQPQQGRRRNA